MSEQNVQNVRAATEWYTHDPERVEQLARGELDFLAFFDPDVDWDASRLADVIPDLAQVYRGHEGVRTYWRRWLEAWRDIEFDIQDVLDAGDDVVVLIHNQRQWGRHTGIVSEVPPFGMIYTFRDRKVVRWRIFPGQRQALEAAGLA